MQALVTGASGFVGSALCRGLRDAGHSVRGLTRDPDAARARVGAAIELVQGSVGDPQQIAKAALGCDVLLHAAGLPPVAAPERVLRWLHVAGAENVLRAARHAGVRRIVHMSASEVSLTREDRMHWDERRVLPYAPLGAFAQTKLMAEELVLTASDDDLQVVALRPARLWGPDDVDGIARFVSLSRRGGSPLFAGGRNIVATTHIDNLLKAALLACVANDAPARAYYITDGEFIEAREWFGRYFAALGLPAPQSASLPLAWARASFSEKVGRDGGAQQMELLRNAKSALFDVSRAVHDLNYEPSIRLEEKLEELATWVKAQGGCDAIAARARPLPRLADVDAQVALAGGD